jgi:hypothetical protein
MNLQVLAYPFLFLALFFESFLLVTFLSKDARSARGKTLASGQVLPTVSIIVP